MPPFITQKEQCADALVVRDFVSMHRSKLRVFFLPKRAPEMNPDEQVWNEIKTNRIGKQPVKDKMDLKKRLYWLLKSVQNFPGSWGKER